MFRLVVAARGDRGRGRGGQRGVGPAGVEGRVADGPGTPGCANVRFV